MQRRALRYSNNLKKGEIVSRNDVIALRPITDDNAIPPYFIEDIIGKKINKNVKNDDLVKLEDFHD